MRSIAILLALAGCGSNSTPAETCTQAVCPLGGHTYKFCSSAHATSCRYLGSDNKSFACKSCSDCASAANQIASWCSTGTNNMGGTTNGGTTNGGTTNGGTNGGGTTSGQPLTGCNGLVSCYIDCNQSNPIQDCYDDCDAGATQNALDLLSNYGTCIDTNCYQAINADGGKPYCDSTSDDPTGDMVCSACYTRILATNGVCHSAQLACMNDKP
jgi:hypothetical protein